MEAVELVLVHIKHDFTYVDNGDGTHTQKCKICDYLDETTTAKHELIYTYNKNGGKDAENYGSHQEKCELCGYDKEVMHDENTVRVDIEGKDSTCTYTGLTDRLVCDNCGWYRDQEILPVDEDAHDYAEPKIEFTREYVKDNMEKLKSLKICENRNI